MIEEDLKPGDTWLVSIENNDVLVEVILGYVSDKAVFLDIRAEDIGFYMKRDAIVFIEKLPKKNIYDHESINI